MKWVVISLSLVFACKPFGGEPSEDKSLGKLIARIGDVSATVAKQIDGAVKKLFVHGDADELTTLIRKGGKVGALCVRRLSQQVIIPKDRFHIALEELHNATHNLPKGSQRQLWFAPLRDDAQRALAQLLSAADKHYRALPHIAGADTALHKNLLVEYETDLWTKQLAEIGDPDLTKALTPQIERLRQLSHLATRRVELHQLFRTAGSVPFLEQKLTKLPTWEIVAPDGSKHFLLGTMHNAFATAEDVFAHPKLKRAMQNATTFMPEHDETTGLSFQLSLKHPLNRELVDYSGNLRKDLGDPYYTKLKEQFPANVSVENTHPATATLTLQSQVDVSVGLEGMDEALIVFGKRNKKSIVELESSQDAVDTGMDLMQQHDAQFLKDLIDNGGTNYYRNAHNHMQNSYLNGDWEELVAAHDLIEPTAALSLDKRNRGWIENIVANCQKGQNCLIFGGLAHMLGSSDNIVSLLRSRGYRVTAHAP